MQWKPRTCKHVHKTAQSPYACSEAATPTRSQQPTKTETEIGATKVQSRQDSDPVFIVLNDADGISPCDKHVAPKEKTLLRDLEALRKQVEKIKEIMQAPEKSRKNFDLHCRLPVTSFCGCLSSGETGRFIFPISSIAG